MSKFVHLHTHSHYSLLDGLTRIGGVVGRGKTLGVKPILGVEAYVAPKDRTVKENGDRYYHLILLAENETGWKNLIKLVSRGHLEGFYYKPRVDKQLLREYHAGLIATSACLGGEIGQALLAGRFEEAVQIAKEHEEIFG